MQPAGIIRALLVILFVISFVACSGGGSGDDLSNNACATIGLPTKDFNIINGTACADLERSAVTRIAVYDANAKLLALCSGTLITPTVVLTAAHCIAKGTKSVAVIFGPEESTDTIFAESVRIHPDYVPLSPTNTLAAFNDVALVTLQRGAQITPLAILVNTPIDEGDIMSIYGFGVNESEEFDFADLRSGEMRIESITDNHIFARFEGEGSNTCQGDSGGPAVVRGSDGAAIVGVTSSGALEDCGEGDTSLFVNLQNESVQAFLLNEAPGITLK